MPLRDLGRGPTPRSALVGWLVNVSEIPYRIHGAGTFTYTFTIGNRKFGDFHLKSNRNYQLNW